jgi:zinc transport system ATP-binding protein
MSIAMAERVLEVNHLTYRYSAEPVLEDTSFALERGDILGLIGPNGSGKSTLLRLILRLLPLQAGTIRLFGSDLGKFRSWHRVGYVRQRLWDFDQRFPATVHEVVATGRFARAGLFHPLRRSDHHAIQESLAVVGLRELRFRTMGELSAGQQQRAFLARALAGDAELLLLDEPTSAVDPQAQESFFELLGRLNRERGLTIVLVSHDLGTVAAQANKLACLNRRLIAFGPVQECVASGALERLYQGKPVIHAHDWTPPLRS